MPKEIPKCPKKPETPLSAALAHTYSLELKTPLFGGGVEAGENDPSHPIRATSIRGHLRFWWRATRGRRFANPAALWLREEEIFGSTRFPSPVRISVEFDPKTPPAFINPTEFNRFGPDGYALFAAIQNGNRVIQEGLKFKVSMAWISPAQLKSRRAALNEQLMKAKEPPLPAEVADVADDLRDAMWAWVNFGGIGGRTRRGCGALLCHEDGFAPKSVAEIEGWLLAAQQRFGVAATTAPLWSQLGTHLYYRPQPEPAINAWLTAMSAFKTFRQGEGVGRNRRRPGSNRPGRSYFPEPETIRQTMNQRDPKHTPFPKPFPNDAFPRAEFGLPIVFQFQGGEVDQTVLYPRVGNEKPERMASPLILKPLCLKDGNAVAVIVPLVVPWFSGVDLTLRGRDQIRRTFPQSSTRRPDLGTYPNSPLAGSPSGSAIEAFLAFAQNADNNFRRA